MRRSREAAEPGSSSQGGGNVQRDVETVVIFLLHAAWAPQRNNVSWTQVYPS